MSETTREKKEDADALVMRGSIGTLASKEGSLSGLLYHCHLLEVCSKERQPVVRSTWAGELFNRRKTSDVVLIFLGVLEETFGGRRDSARQLA